MQFYPLITAAFLLLTATSARADDSAAAESTFQRGKAHLDAGRFAEACADFKLSLQLDSSVGTLLNLGECHDKLGQTASAWASFNKAAVKASIEGQPRRRDYAKQRAAKLKPRLTHLELRAAAERPTGFAVTRDGEDATLIIGVPVPVDPGEYAFAATAPGHESWSKSVWVKGEGKSITVDIPALVVETSASGPTPGANGDPSKANSKLVSTDSAEFDTAPRRKRHYIALGVGAVGLAATATGLVFGNISRGKLSDSEEFCDADNVCEQTGFDLMEDGKSAANISTALVGVGAVALITGGFLWFTAPSSKTSNVSALRATPLAGPGEFGLAISGGF